MTGFFVCNASLARLEYARAAPMCRCQRRVARISLAQIAHVSGQKKKSSNASPATRCPPPYSEGVTVIRQRPEFKNINYQ